LAVCWRTLGISACRRSGDILSPFPRVAVSPLVLSRRVAMSQFGGIVQKDKVDDADAVPLAALPLRLFV